MKYDLKIVRFDKHCETCKHKGLPESEDPCFDCQFDPVNMNTDKPTKWEENK